MELWYAKFFKIKQLPFLFLLLTTWLTILSGCNKKHKSEETPTFTEDSSYIAITYNYDSLKGDLPVVEMLAEKELISMNGYINTLNWVEQIEDLCQSYKDTVLINGVKYFVVEGDNLFTCEELKNYYSLQSYIRHYYIETEYLNLTITPSTIIGKDEFGNHIKWNKPTFRFCISFHSFPDSDKFTLVETNVIKAMNDWNNTLRNTLKFEYLSQFNRNTKHLTENEVDFIIIYENILSTEIICDSFSPDKNFSQRRIKIFPAFFSSVENPYSYDGVFRHEFGHALGLYHNHFDPQAPNGDCLGESEIHSPVPIYDITCAVDCEYDEHSVMHYLCKGGGSKDLKITDCDILGICAIYGNMDECSCN